MAMTLPAEAYELSIWARRVGADDPLPYLQDLALIDTDAIRSVGMNVWGGADIRSGPWGTGRGGHSPARTNLEDEAARLLRVLYAEVSNGWNDTEYEVFQGHMEALTQRMNNTAAHFSTVGDVLVGIADEFELRWMEVIGFVVSAAGLIISVVGAATAIYTWWTGVGAVGGVVVAVIGMVLAAVGMAITYLSTIAPRLEELAAATEQLNNVAPAGQWVEPGQ